MVSPGPEEERLWPGGQRYSRPSTFPCMSRRLDEAKLRGGVMELTLSDEELEFLLNILEQRHQEVLEEITHTDRREFKEALRRNEKVLESLVCRLRGMAVQESKP